MSDANNTNDEPWSRWLQSMPSELRPSIGPLSAEELRSRLLSPASSAALVNIGTSTNMGDMKVDSIAAGDIIKVYIDNLLLGVNDPIKRGQLRTYLLRVANKFKHLPLLGVAPQLDQSEALAMAQVYIQATTKQGELLSRFVATHSQIILLGDPGSGKSTFLKYLAWAFACRGSTQQTVALDGWPEDVHRLPVFLPLLTLAGHIARQGTDKKVVRAACIVEIDALDVENARDLFNDALVNHTVLFLFDGLDEVPLKGIPGVSASRRETLNAVYEHLTVHQQCQAIITCRTQAFDIAFQGNWSATTLAPFTYEQVRGFARSWYKALAIRNSLDEQWAESLSKALINRIEKHSKLKAMAEIPLLLTLMAFILFKNDKLPFNRLELYKRILDLLFGEWDRSKGIQESLSDAVGIENLDSSRLSILVNELSYDAHAKATSIDGRGRLTKHPLIARLHEFFKQVGGDGATAERFLDYIEQRSGLLVPDTQDTYVFVHLTLQEYCASCHIKQLDDPIDLLMQHRHDDRWREVIFLTAGLIKSNERRALLNELVSDTTYGQAKVRTQRYRDLILATEIADEIDRLQISDAERNKIDLIQQKLRPGLQDLLCDSSQEVLITERVRAGLYLGRMGDARYPVGAEAWLQEIVGEVDATGKEYFCRVDAGAYSIGGLGTDSDADADEQPYHAINIPQPFLIARYPVTNEQWRFWTQTLDQVYDRNQPVVNVSWLDANEFCRLLSDKLGYTIRLPTEYEWEAAARGPVLRRSRPALAQRFSAAVGLKGRGRRIYRQRLARRYPWGDQWRADYAACADGQNYQPWEEALPVGCFPAGAAPCGALDMAGNVWEWTADSYAAYQRFASSQVDETRRMIRGGSFDSDRSLLRCSARSKADPEGHELNIGFRVVVELTSPQSQDVPLELTSPQPQNEPEADVLAHPDTIAKAIAAALPPNLQSLAPKLADQLTILVAKPADEPEPEVAAALGPALAALAGRQLPVGSSLISFGADSQLGDVMIGDVAGGNIVKISISIARQETTSQTVSAGEGGTISNVVQISGSGNTIYFGYNSNEAATVLPVDASTLTDGATVFLASGGTDSPALDALALHLRLRGLRVWREPELGAMTSQAYDKALAAIDAAVVVLSPESCDSDRFLRVELPAIWARFDSPNSPFWVVPLLDRVGERVAARTLSSSGLRSSDLRSFALDGSSVEQEQQIVRLVRQLLGNLLRPHLRQAVARHDALGLHLFTHTPAGVTSRADLVLDWQAHFGTRAQARWPDRDEWATLLLPALADVRELLGASKAPRLRIDGNFHLSAGYALGHQLVETTKISTEVWASTTQEWWGVERSGQLGPKLVEDGEPPPGGAAGNEITLELSLTQDARGDVLASLMAEPLSLAWRKQFTSPPVREGDVLAAKRFIASPAHAAALADQVANAILIEKQASLIHLFGPLPQALAVMVGSRLNTAGPVQCYEYVRDRRIYIPSVLLR